LRLASGTSGFEMIRCREQMLNAGLRAFGFLGFGMVLAKKAATGDSQYGKEVSD
jgi:hypothetical protein